MASLGPMVVVAEKPAAGLIEALGKAGAFPIVETGWADAPTAISEIKPAALVVAAAIFGTGASLFRGSVHELMDVQADEPFVQAVREAAQQIEGVRQVEKLWIRKTGLEYLADIHLEVDPQLTVAEGHAIGHRVKDRLLAQFHRLRDVLVHLEPHQPDTAG